MRFFSTHAESEGDVGVLILVAESDAGFAVVIAAMVVLWLIATIHHSLLAKAAPPPPVAKTL